MNNNNNTIRLQPYYAVAYNNHRKYLELIRGMSCPPLFNGIIEKKYIFEQIRHTNELNWWIEEFFDLWFNSYTKETLEHWLTHSRTYRKNLNKCMMYYVTHGYLSVSEQNALKNIYIDLKRIGRRVKRRLTHKI